MAAMIALIFNIILVISFARFQNFRCALMEAFRVSIAPVGSISAFAIVLCCTWWILVSLVGMAASVAVALSVWIKRIFVDVPES